MRFALGAGRPPRIHVKVCGLTDPVEARGCAQLGVDAVGCVFFAKSPRNVDPEQARSVFGALPDTVARVGVFVNESFEWIRETVESTGAQIVQLHGRETPELVERLRDRGIGVIKTLFVDGSPHISAAGEYPASAYLVECSRGPLPGGNAATWNWESVRGVDLKRPLILAGGLKPANILQAVRAAEPSAVDVSSGVEIAPGRKDLQKVAAFVKTLRSHLPDAAVRNPFNPASLAGLS